MSVSPFHIEIDKVDRESWEQLITQFHDVSQSQVWLNDTSAGRKNSISHIVLKAGVEILGCCQVVLRHVSFYKIGLADIQWGPLYMKKGEETNSDALLQLVRGIKDEYAIKRGYLVRIWPHAKGDKKVLFKQILEDEGFSRNVSERPYRTLILDLSPPLDEIRKNFLQKWRNHLNKAERSGLTIVQGTSDNFYQIFLMLAHEMVERKNLTKAHNEAFEKYRRIQAALPEQFKMQIMICQAGTVPVCAAILSAVGDTGVYVFGATGEKGLEVNGAYLLQWYMIQWMKEKGIAYYDLGAFNPQRNPGVYHFKLGVAGKKEWEETFLGEYHGCFNLSGRMVELLIDYSKFLKRITRNRNTNK